MKTNLSLGFIGGGINSTIGKMHYLASKLDNKWKLVSGFFSRNKKTNIKSGISYNVNRSRVYHSLQSFINFEKKKFRCSCSFNFNTYTLQNFKTIN